MVGGVFCFWSEQQIHKFGFFLPHNFMQLVTKEYLDKC